MQVQSLNKLARSITLLTVLGLHSDFAHAQARSVTLKPIDWLFSYVFPKSNHMYNGGPKDLRPKREILADLKKLERSQLIALREEVLGRKFMPAATLDAMGMLMPDGHRQFLRRAVGTSHWATPAIKSLSQIGEAEDIVAVLTEVPISRYEALDPIAHAPNRRWLEITRKTWRNQGLVTAAYVLGLFGSPAMAEIKQITTQGPSQSRRMALRGLSRSEDRPSIRLLIELVDKSISGEAVMLADRFVREGSVHVEMLEKWFREDGSSREVAVSSLSRIRSDRGVAFLLRQLGSEPLGNQLASRCSKASPRAVRHFIVSRLGTGSKVEKLNGLLLAHHLERDLRVWEKGDANLHREFMKSSADPEWEVRRESLSKLVDFGGSAKNELGRRSLVRLAELCKDTHPRVRSEAAIQASQYLCPELVLYLEVLANRERDDSVYDTMVRSIESLRERIRQAPGTGQKAVSVLLPKP